MGAIVGPRRPTRGAFVCAVRLACCLGLVLTLVAAPVHADDANPPKPPGLQRIPGPLPTSAPDILMLADVLVRGGHVPEARLLLQQVIQNFPDTGWQKWGYLGMGFLELARGRMEAARPYYQLAAGAGFSQDTALVAMALLDGQAGNGLQSAALLDAMASDPGRPLALQQAAGLSAGYVRYWAGDYQGAAVAFAALADNHPESPLADDALYGLARSFSQLGDPESAEQVLERVNEMPAQGFDDQHVRPALRGLALREIIRATRERYGAVALGQPEQMLIAVLDVNGRVLAHGSLRALAKQGRRAAVGSTLAKAAQDAQAALARSRKTTRLTKELAMGPAPTGATGSATVTKAATDDTVPTPATVPPESAADPAHPGAAHPAPSSEQGGGGGGVILLLLIVGAIYLIRRRWGLPTFFRRAASRPAGR